MAKTVLGSVPCSSPYDLHLGMLPIPLSYIYLICFQWFFGQPLKDPLLQNLT